MKDVIDLLLTKQATLEADKEAEKARACEKIDAEYAERSETINALLDRAGYVPTVETVDEPVEEVAEESTENVAEAVNPAEANTQNVF